jgi:tetratricopeptide (TPR) repeat protein
VNRPVRRLGGKKLVVEYNDRSSDAPGLVAQAAEDPAITRARTAYLSGNRKLFDGDVDGAIAAYQASLELYPGYVGGYRGLGLAYAQRGDRDQALEALQTYVTTVPGAKDVVLIKKRIARLQGK